MILNFVFQKCKFVRTRTTIILKNLYVCLKEIKGIHVKVVKKALAKEI